MAGNTRTHTAALPAQLTLHCGGHEHTAHAHMRTQERTFTHDEGNRLEAARSAGRPN